jgi:hypothetical protein
VGMSNSIGVTAMSSFKMLRGFLLVAAVRAYGQTPCPVKHLAIFDADAAEFTEERSVELHGGSNAIDWRSLAPQTVLGTLRVNAEQADVVRQSITMDGPEARGQKTPVLHLVLLNRGANGPHKVRLDYLAPKLSWKADYAMELGPIGSKGVPDALLLDGWVSVRNETGMDICAAAADLVAGEVQLLNGGVPMRDSVTSQAVSQVGYYAPPTQPAEPTLSSLISPLSVFSRVALARDIVLEANSYLERFPLAQRIKLPVEQRNVFENEATTQTLGRGGFTLLPRGLEVRLVVKNRTQSALPAGIVSIYAGEGQLVGQDRIQLTPPGADLSVSQGRSNTLQGTRRVIERSQVMETGRYKLVTKVEVVIENRGDIESPVVVREGIERFGRDEWSVTDSSHVSQRTGEHSLEFKVTAPAKGTTKVTYTVEVR